MPEVKEAITFTVAMPEDLPEIKEGYVRIYYIVRNHEGEVEFIPTTLSADGKTLTFTSDKFSTYAIAYADIEDIDDNTSEGTGNSGAGVAIPEPDKDKTTAPKTGDNVIIVAAIALVAVAGIVICRKIRKTK